MVVPHVVSKHSVSTVDEASRRTTTEQKTPDISGKLLTRPTICVLFAVLILVIIFYNVTTSAVLKSYNSLFLKSSLDYVNLEKTDFGNTNKLMGRFHRPRKLLNFLPNRRNSGIKKYKDIPDHKDWRESGVVSPVKNQGDCNAGWAFATAAAVESQNAIENEELLELSAQELVDCDRWNNGCVRGSTETAISYALENGLETADDYPFTGNMTGKCLVQKEKRRVKLTNAVLLPNEEDTIVWWVALYGPVTFEMYAPSEFLNYKSGIFNPKTCKSDQRHSMTIVGYGQEGEQAYWIVKNSFGTAWGEGGYMKLAMGNNACGMKDYVTGYEV